MFYSTQILAKKGPLGTIWIAAHLDRRLKRHQVFEANIAISVDSIINPEAPLALRLSGQLLLGVVKVYSKKVGYLFQDCNDALVKVKQAFKADEVDLPRDGKVAAHATITLPDDFNSLDFLSSTFSAQDDDDFQGDQVVPLKMGKRDSFLLADDISLLLGSQSSLDGEERFEVSGDEMERHLSLSLGEPEQLRRNMTPASEGNLYVGDGTPGSYGGDEQMDAPPDDMIPQLDSVAQPPSVQEEDMHVDDALPAPFPDDLGANLDNLLPSHPEDAPEENIPPTAAQKGRKGGKKKRVQLDVGPDHCPATQLDGQSIRTLLKDRAPLLRPRQALAERSLAVQRLQHNAADLAEDAGDSLLMRPLLAGLPLALHDLCMPPAEIALASPSKSKARKSKAPAQEEAEEDQIEATAPEQDHYDAPDAPADVHDFPMDVPTYEDAEPMLGEDGAVDGAAFENTDTGALSPGRSASAAQHYSAPGDSMEEELGALEGGEEAQKDDQNSFTARTTHVAARLKAEFAGVTGQKKRRLQSGEAQVGGSVSLGGLVEGKTRADACRWFFEVLVLKSRNYVELEQPKSYGDISIRPTSRLLTAQ